MLLASGCALVADERPGLDEERCSVLIERGLSAEAEGDPEKALQYFREALVHRPEDGWLLQKAARQLSDLATLSEDRQTRRAYLEEALALAEAAVAADPASAINELSVAVVCGKLAAESGVGDRVELVRRVRTHAERALAIDPDYAWAYHVLGRWHVEVSNLGLGARAFVALFLGGLPEASMETGLGLLQCAVELEPGVVAHHVELGFAYAKLNRDEEARACWQRAQALPIRDFYDQLALERIQRDADV